MPTFLNLHVHFGCFPPLCGCFSLIFKITFYLVAYDGKPFFQGVGRGDIFHVQTTAKGSSSHSTLMQAPHPIQSTAHTGSTPQTGSTHHPIHSPCRLHTPNRHHTPSNPQPMQAPHPKQAPHPTPLQPSPLTKHQAREHPYRQVSPCTIIQHKHPSVMSNKQVNLTSHGTATHVPPLSGFLLPQVIHAPFTPLPPRPLWPISHIRSSSKHQAIPSLTKR